MPIDAELLKLQNDARFLRLLEFLLDNEYIQSDSSAAGITRQILGNKSLDKLTEKQINRFKEDVLPLIKVGCKECGLALDVSEALEAYQNDDGCGNIICLSCYDLKNEEE